MKKVFLFLFLAMASLGAFAQTTTVIYGANCGPAGLCSAVQTDSGVPATFEFATGNVGVDGTYFTGYLNSGATMVTTQVSAMRWNRTYTYAPGYVAPNGQRLTGTIYGTYWVAGCRIVGGRATSCTTRGFTLTHGVVTVR